MIILQFIMPVGIGGVENVVFLLHSNLIKDKEHESYIAISKSYYKKFTTHFDIRNDENILCVNDESSVEVFSSLKKILSVLRPDIILTHARRECILACLLRKNAAVLRTQHMAESPRIPVTFWEKRLLAKNVSKWIFTSESLRQEYLESKKYISPKDALVIYNGVPDLAQDVRYHKNNKFCIIARLTVQKGIDILLDELKKMPETILSQITIDIYGEGPELSNISEQIKKNGLESVVLYKGTTNNPRELFNDYSSILFPSRYEGLPLTMLEAMSFSLPVTTHDVGCVKEFIVHKKNGWIIDSHFNWEVFFREFLDMSVVNYQSVCDESRSTFENKFTIDIMYRNYLSVFENDSDR